MVAGLVAACGGDGPQPPDDGWTPTQAEIDQAIAAWQAGTIKTCSLDAIFPRLALTHPIPPREGWDVTQVDKRTDPNRVWRTDDAQPVSVLFLAYPRRDSAPGETISYHQDANRVRSDEQPFAADLAYDNGHCTIHVDGKTVFDDDLHTVRVSGIVPDAALATPVKLAVIAADHVPSNLAPLAAGTQLVDFSPIASAISDALFPAAYLDQPTLAKALAPLFELSPERAQDLFAEGDVPFWHELLVPQTVALPSIGITRDVNPSPVTYRSALILGDAELATLRQTAELHLIWSYAGSNLPGTPSAKISQFEVVLHRTADLQYQLTSIRYLGTADQSPARAAACVADHLDRLRADAGAVPAGSYLDDVEPCQNLATDLPAAVAGDATATASAVKLLADAYRLGAPAPAAGKLPPSDGGVAIDLSLWRDFDESVLVAIDASGSRASLTAAPSRIAAGFLASLAALDAHPLSAEARKALVGPIAGRALEAAEARDSAAEDYRPLTAAQGARFAAALRTDALGGLVAGDADFLVRDGSGAEIDHDAALTCLGAPTLDAQRAALAALAQRAHANDDPRATWALNVLRTLLGWSYADGDVGAIAGTYCVPDFVTWASQQVAATPIPCTYGGVTFDRGADCAK